MNSKRNLFACLVAPAILCLVTSAPAQESDAQPPSGVLIKNVSIFNGTSESLITGKDVVVVDNRIDKLIAAGSAADKFDQVIDGQGGYLSPGLIDMHWHMSLGVGFEESAKLQIQFTAFLIADDAKELLMRGFTTCRDAAGPVVGVQQAIDRGLIIGPRIYPSEIGLSQYSGHIDLKKRFVNR